MRGSRGYTVIELIVTLGLATVVVLAAGQLIAAAGRLYGSTGSQIVGPKLTSVATSLRRDFHRSAAVAEEAPSWDERQLELAAWDGSRIRYSLQGEALVREVTGPAGNPAGRRIVANGVSAWWWRKPSPHSVEVRVTILPRPSLGPDAMGVNRYTVQRIFALRGWPDGRSW
jgi:hypothetical protein